MSEDPSAAVGRGVPDDPSIPVLTERIVLPKSAPGAAQSPPLLGIGPLALSEEGGDRGPETGEAGARLPEPGHAAADSAPDAEREEGRCVLAGAASGLDESSAASAAEPAKLAGAPIESPASLVELATGDVIGTVAEAASDGARIAARGEDLQTPRTDGQPIEGVSQPEASSAAAAASSEGEYSASFDAQVDALCAAVLQRVTEHLPRQVNATVRELMRPALDEAITRIADEAQIALRIELRDLVEQAVREEFSRPRSGETKH